MFGPYFLDLLVKLSDFALGLLNGGAAVALAAPPFDILGHLGHPPLLLLDGVAILAHRPLRVCIEDELEPARFAGAVFLGTLLAESAPFPPTAAPELLVEVAHGSLLCCCWLVFLPLSSCETEMRGSTSALQLFSFVCMSLPLASSLCSS